jgi:hypothetical protein
VTAEVFAPGSKKSVVRIDGEWNGKMMAKYASGCNEVFMDVSKIPIHKKICRKVAEQVIKSYNRRLKKTINVFNFNKQRKIFVLYFLLLGAV